MAIIIYIKFYCMQQPIARRHPRHPKDILLNISKTNKTKNLYTFNPASSRHNSSFKQQAFEMILNPQANKNNKQQQLIHYNAEKQHQQQNINQNNDFTQEHNKQGNNSQITQRQSAHNFEQNIQYQLGGSEKPTSGIIVKQKLYVDNSPQIFAQSQLKSQLNQQKQQQNLSSQRQFNRLALSLMGVKRTKFNNTCMDTRSSFSIRQINNKKNNQFQLTLKPQYRYNSKKKLFEKKKFGNKQQDGTQIYKHSFYPFTRRKIQSIKQQVNKISGQSRLRRKYSKNQSQNIKKSLNYKNNNDEQQQQQQQIQMQEMPSPNKKINYSQILQSRQKTSKSNYIISIKTSLANLKNLLNQHFDTKFIQIQVPLFFIKPPSQLSGLSMFSSFNSQILTNQSIHIFSSLDIPITSISIRKYSNCIVIINHNICIIWHEGQQGKKYIGSWKNKYFDEGQKEGLGMEWAPGKYVYYGQFKNNKRNGFGVMKMNSRQVIIGYWRNGKHIQFGIGKNIAY